MKAQYIAAIGALGCALAIVRPCTAAADLTVVMISPQIYPATEPPAKQVPAGYVWNGSEYVGQVGAKYYYLGPNNTWLTLDATRQHRFENGQSSQTENTRSQGPVKGENAVEQTGQVQETGSQGPEMEQSPGWNDPNWQSSQFRNTRYQGHDMGQTHPVAPPLPENSSPPNQ